ncbi:hypothetical protein BO82DRAFT_402826 [Aspergillus uvarum CBS 121591]|uniref:Uncharacterized protein n=1 Tax=Aspergillus uvarum CBS 121591 TaxID=1448315 RepID=A0A319CAW4_9EURO|nr:hypothetical protein BO82DRAFT_402826 [Aspergillus uvarum CBS 121591]PYH80961.1 hypothetical protein BO82DRAFT_402826 [Aspergillus uvarum CBS 121591]
MGLIGMTGGGNLFGVQQLTCNILFLLNVFPFIVISLGPLILRVDDFVVLEFRVKLVTIELTQLPVTRHIGEMLGVDLGGYASLGVKGLTSLFRLSSSRP